MLKIKAYYGDWTPCTKEKAEEFYNSWAKRATNVKDKDECFNRFHIRGGQVVNGKVKI